MYIIKVWYNDDLTAMEILQNQAGMTKAEAERRTRQIFDSVEYQRKVLKIPVTVEDLLVAEINIANGNI